MMRRIVCLALALCLLAASVLCAAAESEGEAEDITKQCRFKVSEGDRDKMFDRSVRTSWSFSHRDAYVGFKVPDGVEPGWLRVEWFYDPTGYELIEYDADMNVLRQRDKTASFPNIYTVLPLLPNAKYVQLKMLRTDQKICNLRVYSAGRLPHAVQQWQKPVDKADIMFVSAHQDDEIIFFGGAIPYYATALKRPCVVVYMANCNRHRRNEALNGLWKMGMVDYPEFINLKDEKVGSVKEAVALWGGSDNILSLLVQRIRRFKPEVIVTHDLDGEYGHNQHKATAQAMMAAIEAAADPAQFPESAEVYGAWQVKKLYHHLYKENQISMDWETKLDALNGYTPLEVARMGFKEHASQTQYYVIKSHGTYDNSKFGLYYTSVGPDVKKNDFLENIDPNASADYVAAHADEIAAYPVWPELPEEELDEQEADAESESDTAEAEESPDDALAQPAADTPPAADAQPVADTQPASDPQPAADAQTAADAQPADIQPTADAQPASGRASPARHSSGGAGPAVAMIAAGVVAVGAGGWYAVKALGPGRRRHRRRRR